MGLSLSFPSHKQNVTVSIPGGGTKDLLFWWSQFQPQKLSLECLRSWKVKNNNNRKMILCQDLKQGNKRREWERGRTAKLAVKSGISRVLLNTNWFNLDMIVQPKASIESNQQASGVSLISLRQCNSTHIPGIHAYLVWTKRSSM